VSLGYDVLFPSSQFAHQKGGGAVSDYSLLESCDLKLLHRTQAVDLQKPPLPPHLFWRRT